MELRESLDLGTTCHDEEKVAALREALPRADRLERLASGFKAVAHPARLAILHLLSAREGCVCDIAHTLEMPVSTVSQHLRLLKRSGLLASRQDGKWVIYSVTDTPIARAVSAPDLLEAAE